MARPATPLATGFVPQVPTTDDEFARATKRDKVLTLLVRAGLAGVRNTELNPVTFRYGAAIHDLREDGHIIDTECLDSMAGLWKFTYRGRKALHGQRTA